MAQSKKDKVERSVAYPELVYGSRKDGDTERWEVQEGQALRGEAWTNFIDHKIKVPLADDETARTVRAHELVHAKVSPNDPDQLSRYAEWSGLEPEAIISAEEVRINAILKATGDYDINNLVDGSEKESGKRLAREGSDKAYDQAIAFGAGLIGGKAFRNFIAGVRSVNKEWAKDLRQMELAILKQTRGYSATHLSENEPTTYEYNDETQVNEQLSWGFMRFTHNIANVISSYFKSNQGYKPENTGVPLDYGKDGWATLKIHSGIKLDTQVKGHLARRKKASSTGKRIAYPSRLLTDPEKRIFSQKPRNNGGILLLDLSGSMSLSIDDIETMVEKAPGALIAGYSHSQKNKYNMTILADRGKRVSSLKNVTKGQGNGVDGPALDWAIGQRRGSEPIIWVCDGMVTNKRDQLFQEGAKACAEMVKRHKVIMVPTLGEAVKVLSNPRTAKSKAIGVVGALLPKHLGGQNGKTVTPLGW